ncbi:MAG: hypothetical protein JST_000606 [Candidatus Parcubacteria bacterium]|nr:MAG: hypothetical protein JST_5660 [Candidatus Parcubacteria bacterium]
MKTNRKFWLVVFIIFLLIFIITAFCYFYQVKKSGGEVQNIVPEPGSSLDNLEGKDLLGEDVKAGLGLYHRAVFEIVPREGDDTQMDIKFLGVKDPEPISFQELSVEDKDNLHLNRDERFQILLTDSEGRVLQYRIMKDENDIVTEY